MYSHKFKPFNTLKSIYKNLHIPLLCSLLMLFGISIQAQDTLTYKYDVKKLNLGDSLEIAYIEIGTGEQTLVFLHGLASYLPAWQYNLDSLSTKYRCIAIDLPGYGKSSKGKFSYTMSFFAHTLEETMKALSIEKASIVGHSMGGQIAMTFALKYPEMVEKLILVAPAGFETFKPEHAQLLENFTTPEQIKNTPDQKIRTNLEVNFSKMPESAEFMITDRIKMKTATDFNGFSHAVSKSVKGMLSEPVFEQLDQLKAPTLIIYGEDDKLIPNKFFNAQLTTQQVGELGKEKISNAQLKMIQGAGHMVQFEKPQEVNQYIFEFMKVK